MCHQPNLESACLDYDRQRCCPCRHCARDCLNHLGDCLARLMSHGQRRSGDKVSALGRETLGPSRVPFNALSLADQ